MIKYVRLHPSFILLLFRSPSIILTSQFITLFHLYLPFMQLSSEFDPQGMLQTFSLMSHLSYALKNPSTERDSDVLEKMEIKSRLILNTRTRRLDEV